MSSRRPTDLSRTQSHTFVVSAALQDGNKRSFAALQNAVIASAFGFLAWATPASSAVVYDLPSEQRVHVVDDAKALNVSTINEVNKALQRTEDNLGYDLDVLIVRRLDGEEESPEQLAETVYKRWHGSSPDASKKGVLVLVTRVARGAIYGGADLLKALPEDFQKSILEDSLAKPSADNRFNEAVNNASERIVAVLSGQADPGAPAMRRATLEANFASKEETEASRGVSATTVVVLLIVATFVPMATYFYYTGDWGFGNVGQQRKKDDN
eukprot:CAMPEP_0184656938 /NCGR_PEP_ID=MMETSP0308-20130426/16858_1 /TAXON_ID=38269 /ORGANISM="Gloeochaete witrockiana, Strain SAG 46.84" /LENGTH=268 /DNA_ID=CAMNT_0027094273 /DNA_START=176 /DNA_END=982 /DNA_ORIENTATION=+